MAPTHNEQQGSANPYRSPHAPVDESPPRSSRFRILPTALLWIFALLSLVGHLFVIGMVTAVFVSVKWLDPDPESVNYIFAYMPTVIAASAVGILGDLLGILSARHCWQGRWLRSGIEAMLFIGIIMATSPFLQAPGPAS